MYKRVRASTALAFIAHQPCLDQGSQITQDRPSSDGRFGRYLGTFCVSNDLKNFVITNSHREPGAEGRIRVRPVLISGTEYVPTADPITIKDGLESNCIKAEQIEDPFEASFFLLVHLPYLQPFIDVNKRVARLAANLPFIKKNYYPLSFLKTDRDEYLRAMLDVYERNDINALVEIFVSSYRYSAARYAVIAESLGQPDPIRAKYRQVIKDAVAILVRELCHDDIEVEARVAELSLSVPAEALEDVRRIIGEDIAALNEGNYSKYPVRPSEFLAWQNLQKLNKHKGQT